jgi:uncharacterized cupin superfamily protein
MPKLDLASISVNRGTRYPAPFDEPCRERLRQRLGDAGGLSDFGVNLLTLMPGVWSSQRHWHADEDEFVYVVSGETVLISDTGEKILWAGDCAAFPKGDGNGHHLVNRSDAPCICLEIGARSRNDVVHYPDIDLKIEAMVGKFAHRDGMLYPTR